MKKSEYIEDEFVKFYTSFCLHSLSAKEQDACDSFYDLCLRQEPFTEKQAIYLKFILKKYYPDYDSNLKFKHSYRILDDRKIVYVKESADNKISIAFKFPYSFLETFDKEFETSGGHTKYTYWDPEEKVRKIDLHSANYLKISNFVNENNFTKELSFLELESCLQEALNDQENIIPYAVNDCNTIKLINAEEAAVDFFNNHKKNHRDTDALLAKIMGFPVRSVNKEKSIIEKIVSSKQQFFWMKNNLDFFKLMKTVDTKTCIIIDRNEKEKIWLKKFVEEAKNHIPDKKIRVCFRENQEKDREFNDWIKETDTGGKVDQGDIFIFQYKPPKWVLKEKQNMLFIVTTMITPPSNTITQDFFSVTPCVIYLTEIKPTEWRNKTIVDL
jgi:hypothetical protein